MFEANEKNELSIGRLKRDWQKAVPSYQTLKFVLNEHIPESKFINIAINENIIWQVKEYVKYFQLHINQLKSNIINFKLEKIYC